MFEHGGVLTFDHALDEGACAVGSLVPFALIADPSATFDLLIYTLFSGLLLPNLKLWLNYLHILISLFLLAKLRKILQSITYGGH